MKKCLACYEPLKAQSIQEFHEKCSKKIFGKPKAPELVYRFEEINELAKRIIQNRLAIPGVQPKLSLSLVIDPANQTNTPRERLTIVGLWDGTYVLKPPNKAHPELPENEDLTMHLAEACGIKTAVHSLIRFSSGEIAYIAKRFDRLTKRRKVEKLHQEDMCQLAGLLTENKYNSSMEKVAKITAQFTTNKGLEAVALFQITVFSFLTGNSDMHLKNFSLLKTVDGSVEMTPSYDLLATQLVMPEDKEQIALTLNGKKNRLTRKDFDLFAKSCGLAVRATENVFADFEKRLPVIAAWVNKSFLSDEMKGAYINLVAERAKILQLKIPDGYLNEK